MKIARHIGSTNMDVVSTNMDIDVTMGRAACAAVIIALIIRKRQRRRRKRSTWVREWIRRRHKYGAYHHLMRELQALDVSSYLNFVRMNASTFETLLTKVAPLIARKDTNMRDAIPPGERLTCRGIPYSLITYQSTVLL